MSTTSQHQEEDVIDLKELFFKILQHWYIVVFTTLFALVAAFVYLKATLPVYSVNAMLHVESKNASSDLLLGEMPGFGGKSDVATEIEIIKSRMILGDVSKKLNLDTVLLPDSESTFDRLFNKKNILNIKNNASGVYYTDGLKNLSINSFSVDPILLDKQFKLAVLNENEYELILSEQDTTVIKIKGNNGVPFTQKTEYGLISLDLDYRGLTKTNFLLLKRGLLTSSNYLSSKLSASEKGKRTGILSLSMTGVDKEKITKTLNEVVDVYVAQNLNQKTAEKEKTLEFLEEQLPEIKKELELAERKFNIFRNKNKTVDVTKEAQLLLEQSVRMQNTKLELEQKQAELGARFTDEYPLLQQVKSQLKGLDGKVKEINSRLKALPSVQQKYLKLYRDVQINTELYTNLLNNYQKLKIAKSGEIGNVRVIDKAVQAIDPIKPKKLLIILIAGLSGIFAGIGIILIRSIFNTGVKDSNQIEVITGVSVLANVPRSNVQRGFFTKLKKGKRLHNLLYLEDPQDMAIESLRSLRTALFFSMTTAKNNIIMVTGPSPGLGKSFVSTNFAAVLAASDKRVIVIDADLRRGYMHQHFGQKNIDGISDYVLKNNVQPVKKTLIDTLNFVARGQNPANPAEILMSEKFQDLLQRFSEEYDYVIIDSPPTLAVTDSTIIGSLAGTTLVVARYGVSHLPEIKLTIDRLQAAGSNVTGVIFNDVIKEAGGYGYNYQYGYNYKSK